jgi:hypothetical protein
MTVAAAGRVIRVPISVKQATSDRPISFKLDVMPVFMRAGCNTGACHGAAAARTASASRSSGSTPTATGSA